MADLTVKVPDVGEGIAEVELVSWAVAEGQTVSRNDVIAEVMTDKATVEVPAPADGVIGALTGAVGDILLVGSPLFSLQPTAGTEGAVEQTADDPGATAASEASANAGPPASPAVAAPARPAVAVAAPGAPTTSTPPAAPRQLAVVRAPDESTVGQPAPRQEGRKPTASPAVRRRARDAGIDLRSVTGSGPAGRIEHDDLDAMFEAAPNSNGNGNGTAPIRRTSEGRGGPDTTVTDQPIVGIRRKIAEQMVASTSTIPHITYVEEIDMTTLEELRHTLNSERPDGQPKLTLLPFLIRALVNELADFPAMNAHVLNPTPDEATEPQASPARPAPQTLRTFAGVHVGIATQTDGGLVVPVLRHAEAETLWTSAAKIIALADAARTGSAAPAELSGSTITITSLGALGGLMTTPVINKPETTIVGVNKMVTRPLWDGDAFVPRKVMNLSCSFDHRVIDGWDAANFVQALKRSLEQPALLFVERA